MCSSDLTRERGDHLIVAIVLLLLTFAAVLISVLNGIALFR